MAAVLLIAGGIFARRSKNGPFEWDPRPPTTRERLVAGIWLAAFLFAEINDYADWRIFSGYDKWVLAGLVFGGLVMITRLPKVKRA